MNLEEQVKLHKEISKKIDQLEEQKRALGQTIMQAMPGKALQVGGYLVKRFSRLSVSMTLDQARPFNAVKVEEVVDKEMIKSLYKNGNRMSGVKEVQYIQISILDNQ